jgi:hypothetical protein
MSMSDTTKRGAGRPKAVPQCGPLVLEGGRARAKVEIEIDQRAADELTESDRGDMVDGADALAKLRGRTRDGGTG